MTIHPICIDLKLPEDRKVDIVLVQWHTPVPVQGNQPNKIAAGVASTKRAVLECLRDFLLGAMIPQTPPRPMFIVLPELSLPRGAIPILEDLLHRSNRPMVVVAGLEYLTWDEYVEEIKALRDMPAPDSWLMRGSKTQCVNAATTIIRDDGGRMARYIQPKLHPEDHEQALSVFSGDSVLVFRSLVSRSGERINFCVQICSDFTHRSFVADLRQQIEDRIAGFQLDFTFLLQMQKNQDVTQFKQAIQSYFEPPDRKASTGQGCLLFINNANAMKGKSDTWGKTKLNFPYDCWRSELGCTATYWIEDDGGHNHQAVTMRESGPGIYWLVYKPHYLVDHTPGSGQAVPFCEPAPRFAAIEDLLVSGRLEMNSFAPILPVRHWLEWEWREGLEEYKSELEGARKADAFIRECINEYSESLDAWLLEFNNRDEIPRNVLTAYFCCWEKKGFPRFPPAEKEPLRWDGQCSMAVKQFIRIYTLIWMNRAVFAPGSMAPSHRIPHHSVVGADVGITLSWGGAQFPLKEMVIRFLKYISEPPLQTWVLSKHLLIAVVQDHPVMSEFRRQLPTLMDDFTEGQEGSLGTHLQQGDLTGAIGIPQLSIIHGGDLSGTIGVSDSKDDLIYRVSELIKEALAS